MRSNGVTWLDLERQELERKGTIPVEKDEGNFETDLAVTSHNQFGMTSSSIIMMTSSECEM